MFLRQSTASQQREVGPFVDDTDFKSLETGLTIANTDVKLSKNGAAGVNKNSGGGTHRNNGMYALTFDATDTDTVGELAGSILISGALVMTFKFFVLEEAIYDALFASGAQSLPATAAPGAAGGLLIAGTNAPVTITGSGDALTLTSTGGNGSGLNASGIGTGSGIQATGGTGALAAGIKGIGNPSSTDSDGVMGIGAGAGAGISGISGPDTGSFGILGYNLAAGGGYGIYGEGKGAYAGIHGEGGPTGPGIRGKGGSTSGAGADFAATAGNSNGATFTKAGSGKDIDSDQTDNLDATVSSRATPAQVNTEADTALADVGLTTTVTGRIDAAITTRAAAALFTGITSVAQWLGLIAGKQTGDSTARTEIRATGAGSGTFNETTDSVEAIRDRGDAAWTTATGFSTHSAADVWAAGTRTLTAGTNIALAKGTGVTGFNDLDAAGVRSAVGLASANLDTQLGALPTADENADAALLRDWTSVAGTVPDRSTFNALRLLRNKWAVSGGTLTVKEEDDSTTAWSAAITSDVSAEPIIGSDPT